MLTFKTEYTSVSIDETTELRDFGKGEEESRRSFY